MLKTVSLAVAAIVLSPLLATAAPLKAVAFDLEVVESPTEAPTGIPADRVRKASADIQTMLAASGQVTLVDAAPVKADIEKSQPLRNCNGCDLDIAKKLGADIEVTTALRKSSEVTFSFSGSIRDVKTGKIVSTGVVDVRGSDEASWAHGIKFLIKNRLLDPPMPQSPEALRAALDK